MGRLASEQQIMELLAQESRIGAACLGQMQAALGSEATLDPGVLGTLYQSQLSANGAVQRAQRSYYTPAYLVDYVVEHTLGPLVAGRTPKQLKTLRILDPSCGGGAFLLGVLRFLEARCVALGERPGEWLRSELSGCLVGIDLDSGALAVTKAALLVATGGSSLERLILGDALLPETEVPAVDAIVGNPPWGHKNLHIAASTRAVYKKLFVSAKGGWDPFKFFVERVHQLLPETAAS